MQVVLSDEAGVIAGFLHDLRQRGLVVLIHRRKFIHAVNVRILSTEEDGAAGGTDGVGAVAAQMTMPYFGITSDAAANNQAIAQVNSAVLTAFTFCIVNFNVGANVMNFAIEDGTTVLNSSFSAGDRDIIFSGTYDLPSF